MFTWNKKNIVDKLSQVGYMSCLNNSNKLLKHLPKIRKYNLNNSKIFTD